MVLGSFTPIDLSSSVYLMFVYVIFFFASFISSFVLFQLNGVGGRDFLFIKGPCVIFSYILLTEDCLGVVICR